MSEEELGRGNQTPSAPVGDSAPASQPNRPLLSSSGSPREGEQQTTPSQHYNTFIEKDVMQEARDMVFWWRRKSKVLPGAEDDSEFCLHETECKVKVRCALSRVSK